MHLSWLARISVELRGWPRAVRCLLLLLAALATAQTWAADISPPAILQYFESTYATIEQRAPDLFAAGYGAIYTPPPGRADLGNFSVGYDQYDRFDLGQPGNPTLYGTETGLKTTIDMMHRLGGSAYLDLVWNHSGFTDNSSSDGQGHSFYNAGGYPGLNITLPNDVDGDYHSAFAGGDLQMRLAGLVDIAQEKNFQMIRSPVDPGDSRNIRAGTVAAFGRLANVANANNARFYPDRSLQPIMVFDPTTGEQNIAIYPFNNGNPLHGAAVPENALGYLMRNTQWLVQSIGADGFRVDAAKNMPVFVQNYLDRAVYRSSFRTLLNGQQEQIFSFSEAFDGNQDFLQQFVRKDINPNTPGVIGGNRDALDFPLYFAMQNNLTGNGLNNDWGQIANASFDMHGDGLHNGSQAVKFVANQDNTSPYLSNVAYAYTLMMPGNAIVYFNAHQFGSAAERNFPKDGRGDALGGMYGNAVPGLVDLRNRYGQGNFIERLLEKENYAFERQGSSIVLLSNRLDGGYDSRTIHTDFSAGTRLVELTGNAGNPFSDPFHDIPPLLVVNGDGTVNVRFLRNAQPGFNNFTGNGYLIYGLAAPQGSMSLTNVAQTLHNATPATTGNAHNDGYTNATTRLADIQVVKANSFQVQVQTSAVNLLGNPAFREREADGDNALVKIDGGIDLNHNGGVDFTSPNTAQYGFENFTEFKSPGWFNGDGNGAYRQTIDTTQLADGMHFLTVRVFRHRDDGGPAIYADFKESLYVDRLRPNSALDSFSPIQTGINENRNAVIRSIDKTADSVHVFLNLPANLTDDQIKALANGGNQAGQIDRDLFQYGLFNLLNGNNVLTILTYRMTGNYNIQRLPGQLTSTIFGAGLGDTNFNGTYNPDDIQIFGTVLRSHNGQFNPAADLNGDGLVDNIDLQLLGPRLQAVGADQATEQAYAALVASAPEPATWVLGVLGLLGVALIYARTRRKLKLVPVPVRRK